MNRIIIKKQTDWHWQPENSSIWIFYPNEDLSKDLKNNFPDSKPYTKSLVRFYRDPDKKELAKDLLDYIKKYNLTPVYTLDEILMRMDEISDTDPRSRRSVIVSLPIDTIHKNNISKVGESIMKKLYSIYTPIGVVSTRGKLEDHEYPFAKAFKTKKEAKNYIDSNYIPDLRDYDIDEYNVYEDVSNIFSLDENVFDLDDKGNILYKGKAVLTPKDIQYRDVLEVINELLEDNELPKLSK